MRRIPAGRVSAGHPVPGLGAPAEGRPGGGCRRDVPATRRAAAGSTPGAGRSRRRRTPCPSVAVPTRSQPPLPRRYRRAPRLRSRAQGPAVLEPRSRAGAPVEASRTAGGATRVELGGLGLTPVGAAPAHLAIRLSSEADAERLLPELGGAAREGGRRPGDRPGAPAVLPRVPRPSCSGGSGRCAPGCRSATRTSRRARWAVSSAAGPGRAADAVQQPRAGRQRRGDRGRRGAAAGGGRRRHPGRPGRPRWPRSSGWPPSRRQPGRRRRRRPRRRGGAPIPAALPRGPLLATVAAADDVDPDEAGGEDRPDDRAHPRPGHRGGGRRRRACSTTTAVHPSTTRSRSRALSGAVQRRRRQRLGHLAQPRPRSPGRLLFAGRHDGRERRRRGHLRQPAGHRAAAARRDWLAG